MGFGTNYADCAGEMKLTAQPSTHTHTKMSRKAVPWYLLPFFVNLILVFSVVHIFSGSDEDDYEGSLPASSWLLYAMIAVSSPIFVSLSHMMPDLSIALAVGGVLTSAGLMWTGLSPEPIQLLPFCALAGAGLSLSFQAMSISLSTYFIRQTRTVSCMLLGVTAILLGSLYPWLSKDNISGKTYSLCLCPAILLSSLMPLSHYLYTKFGPRTDRKGEDYKNDEEENEIQPTEESGLTVSFMAALVWLGWGAGIDTTWMAYGWRVEYILSNVGFPAIQLFISFVLLAIKCGALYKHRDWTNWRINVASNYMQLGLLGACGLVLSLACDYLILPVFHNNLLFTLGLTVQFDDLNDLYLIQAPTLPISVNYYRMVSFTTNACMKRDMGRNFSLLVTVTHMCNILALFMTTFLSMILGVQAANLIGLLASVPPLSFVCTRVGLCVVSAVAVIISITRPDNWIDKQRHCVI